MKLSRRELKCNICLRRECLQIGAFHENMVRTVNFSDSWMKPCSQSRTAVRGAGRLVLTFVFYQKTIHLFISAALALSCSRRSPFLKAGTETEPPALGARSLGPWTARGVPGAGLRASRLLPLGRSVPGSGHSLRLGPRGPLRSVASPRRPAGRPPPRPPERSAPGTPNGRLRETQKILKCLS